MGPISLAIPPYARLVSVDSTAPTRRRLRAAGRREQLLDVATDLVAEVGFRGMSVELLARRAGITRAVVYRHFTDLETLLETAVERAMARDQCRLLDEDLWEYDESARSHVKLDPSQALTARQAGDLLAPYIKDVPPFDDSLLPA